MCKVFFKDTKVEGGLFWRRKETIGRRECPQMKVMRW
jgi:hypothetical protein